MTAHALTAPASTTHDSSPAIRVSGLTKRYGQLAVVSNASFDVYRGDVFGLLGPDGSGKSTMIGMLLGLIEPTDGEVDLFGLGPWRQPEGLARVGAIIGAATFSPYLSGRENLRLLAHLRSDVPERRVDEVLELVGLSREAGKRYRHYSPGMRQRLKIGSALLHNPEVLILDQPTDGLDPAGAIEVRALILRLAVVGLTICISSHSPDEIEQVCDRVALIDRGKIVAVGKVADVVRPRRQLAIRTNDQRRSARLLREIIEVERVDELGDRLLVSAPVAAQGMLNAVLVKAGIEVYEFRRSGSAFEHAFLELAASD